MHCYSVHIQASSGCLHSSVLRFAVPVQRAASAKLHTTRLSATPEHQAHSISSSQEYAGGQERESDNYVDAAYRLESLLCGVGDGEDEVYYNLLLEEAPGHKLQVNALLGVLVLSASTAICWLCGKDPAGGASLSLRSLLAGLVGAAAAAPLVAYKLFLWSSAGQQGSATLAALGRSRTHIARPWLVNMDAGQLAAHAALDTLPLLFLTLPAAQAGLTSSFAWSSQAIGRSTGLHLPEQAGFAVALVVTAAVTATVRGTELMADPQQVAVVREAVANADRYYRLTTSSLSSSSSSSSSSQEAEAERRARAFKAIAISWREQEQEVTSLFVTLAIFDFVYFGSLWYGTQDMTAACAAALLANAVDYHAMWRGVTTPGSGRGGRGGANKAQRSSSSSSSSTQRE